VAVSRRRFITISAGLLAAGVVSPPALLAAPHVARWRGVAMGADAELKLAHPDQNKTRRAIKSVESEIRRLEKVFSLFDPTSALSQLNKAGFIDLPPLDLIRCLDDAVQISDVTGGAFDYTVQPLWDLYSRHFAKHPDDKIGPDKMDIKSALERIDYKSVEFSSRRIQFMKPGMKITLNGIAQGYLTDRVTELLKSRGFDNILVDLGEIRGLGKPGNGHDWQVGIKAADGSTGLIKKVPLKNKAIATSGGYGTRFNKTGTFNHLFDPQTGQSPEMWSSISVIADDATRADALSTAFYSLPATAIENRARHLNVSVIAHRGFENDLINF